jgi:two-component system sensor histidine kinase DesK
MDCHRPAHLQKDERSGDGMESERTVPSSTVGAAPLAVQSGDGDGPDVLVASSKISLRLWRLYAYFWLVCLAFPILALMKAPPAHIQLLLALAGLLIFLSCYFWAMWPHLLNRVGRARPELWTSLLLVAMLTALVLGLSLAYGGAFLWLFVGVSAIAGIILPARRAFEITVALTLLALDLGVVIGGGVAQTDWLQLIPLVLLVRTLGVDMIGLALLADALRDLHAARRELARMAVMGERLRMARDLHDLLGHNLSLIVLKSELARRLIVQEPARAADEIQAVEHVARQILREVREAVANEREPTLRSQLDGARQLLEAMVPSRLMIIMGSKSYLTNLFRCPT